MEQFIQNSPTLNLNVIYHLILPGFHTFECYAVFTMKKQIRLKFWDLNENECRIVENVQGDLYRSFLVCNLEEKVVQIEVLNRQK